MGSGAPFGKFEKGPMSIFYSECLLIDFDTSNGSARHFAGSAALLSLLQGAGARDLVIQPARRGTVESLTRT
jgi:hypothetical protein